MNTMEPTVYKMNELSTKDRNLVLGDTCPRCGKELHVALDESGKQLKVCDLGHSFTGGIQMLID